MRACGTCSLCCKLMAVPDVTPHNEWCRHCTPGKGCGIYDRRPEPCRQFDCLWLMSDKVPEHWYPRQAHMVLELKLIPEPLVVVNVDPAHANRWREEPYLKDIRRMAMTCHVIVKVGSRPLLRMAPPDVRPAPPQPAPI